MKYSEEREYKGLPKKYWYKQNFCWYMHDIIASIFRDCVDKDKMVTKIVFKDEQQGNEFEKAEDVIDWLYKNNFETEADLILGKQIFHAILGDMLNFIYESLNTIEKGKIAVSLALLRKPFRDNLLYLEWLLGNHKEFISMVNNQEIEKYAIENIDTITKLKIIKSAMKKIKSKEFFHKMDENVYYDLRYNYKAGNSLQLIWNKANHLVTTGRNIKSIDFNYVFLDKETHLDNIEYYYDKIPSLLFYTYNVVVELYNKFVKEIPKTTRVYNEFLILYKMCDFLGAIDANEYFNGEFKDFLSFPCENCKRVIKINLNSKEFNEFRYGWSFICPECGEYINIARYVFLEDYKK